MSRPPRDTILAAFAIAGFGYGLRLFALYVASKGR